MGMTGGYLRLSQDKLQAALDDSDSLPDLLMSAVTSGIRGDGPSLNIDKAWHGVHFILTGEAWEGTAPLRNVVLGGTEIGDDMGYGPARYLTSEEVQEVAAALQPIDAAEFQRRYNPEEMEENEIYAFNADDAEEELEYFTDAYLEVRQYFCDAAAQGEAMLLYMV